MGWENLQTRWRSVKGNSVGDRHPYPSNGHLDLFMKYLWWEFLIFDVAKIFWQNIWEKIEKSDNVVLITITHQTNKSPAEINDTLSRQVRISCFRALSHFVKFLTLEIQFCRFKILENYFLELKFVFVFYLSCRTQIDNNLSTLGMRIEIYSRKLSYWLSTMQKMKTINMIQDMKIPVAALLTSLFFNRLFVCLAFEIDISLNQVSPNGFIDAGRCW